MKAVVEEIEVVVAEAAEEELTTTKSLMVWILAMQIYYSPMKNWENLPCWERHELQHSNERERATNMMITKAHNEKRKIGAVNIKAAKKYVVTATITGFMNAQRAHN